MAEPERRSFVVSGLVQGVGFRPFVHRLAHELGLAGFVLNRAGEVHVEAEGTRSALESFESALSLRAPALSSIAELCSRRIPPDGRSGFAIVDSVPGDATPFVVPDVATCERCLAELLEPRDRRFQYPFSNCTECGPRLTIIESAPYDRARTTMRGFPLCRECRREYQDPENRRFHAEPTACAACGPRLALLDSEGNDAGGDALAQAATALSAEQIVAIKGIGGFHLACLASSERASAELRRRKGREQKPFAVLVRSLAEAEALCEVSPEEAVLLQSAARPIVLLRRRDSARVASAVAFASPLLGVMLAYTPLQHLLCLALGDAALVMTSGNPSDEPIAFEDDDAQRRLAPLCDRLLTHNRPIHLRCDDSVVRSINGAPSTLRRARGLAPRPTPLGQALRRPLLALGAHDNATFALGRGDHALVSHHLGDLSNPSALHAYRAAITHYERLFQVQPELVVHDLHPDYATSLVARELARERGVALLGVQHHHAHIVSSMVEHGLDGQVLGLACDGSGYGDDGTLWGGEWLLCERRTAQRVAHFRSVSMPGGERAVHEPWRMALAYLLDAELAIDGRLPTVAPHTLRTLTRVIERGFNCPRTSSLGRLFDAVSALCGVCLSSSYEGQAAIELELVALLAPAVPTEAYPYELLGGGGSEPLAVDTRPLLRALLADLQGGVAIPSIARRFHLSLAVILGQVCVALRARYGLSRVVLGGGVFANALLVSELEARLSAEAFQVYRPHAYPAGDGGLSLGQLAIAAARDRQAT